MNRRRLGFAQSALAACVLFAAVSTRGADEPLFPDRVVAKGQGFEIKQSQLDEMYLAFKANRSALGQPVPDAARGRVYADILDKLIATRLFIKRALPEDHEKGKAIAAEFVAEQMKHATSEESFNRQLLATGMSREMFEQQVAEQAVVKAVIDRLIKTNVSVSDEQVRKYYDENGAAFTQPDMVRVQHILISTRDPLTGRELSESQKEDKKKFAAKLASRAKGGEDFAKLARENTDDAASKERGGEYTISRAKDDPRRAMVAEFEAAAFSLPPGQVSDVVTTRFGYHVIKCLEKIPSAKTDFALVAGRIRETLMQEEVQKRLPETVEAMKKEYGVQMFDFVP